MSAYQKKLEKPLSEKGSRSLICCKDNYLRGANLQRLAPFSPQKASQQCYKHCCNTHNQNDFSNKKHTATEYIYTQYRVSESPNAPPPVVSASLTKGKDLKIPCDLRIGQQVQVYSLRENRVKYNGKIGEVCAVVWPQDVSRSIIYVKVAGMQPCFFYSELTAVAQPAPQAVEEVQLCQ